MKPRTKGVDRDEELIVEIIRAQFKVIQDALRALIYFRIIRSELDTDSKFWISTGNSHLQSFVTGWSKCFGSKKEDTHWSKSVQNRQDFRRRLMLDTGFNARSMKNYVKLMISIRNKAFSHTDMSATDVFVPNLDKAQDLLKKLHGQLRLELQTSKNLPTPVLYRRPGCIDMWLSNLEEEAREVIDSAMKASADVSEYQ